MTINGKEYATPAFTFGDMCKLEGWGLPIDSISERPLTFLSGFVALAIGGDLADGQKAIDEHLNAGGSIDELADELNTAIEGSGFFKRARTESKTA